MDDIIQKFQTIYSKIKAEKQQIFLFMVLKMDEYTNKWSVVISAPWITEQNFTESFSYITKILKDNLSENELSTIARLGIFRSDEHLVKLVTNAIRIQDGEPVKLENTQLNGYKIHEAHIFESNPPPVV